jgi:two-component system phosphate regulon response regulator OmpR
MDRSQESHRILIVDDDSRLRDLLERYLAQEGYSVRGVANGRGMDQLLSEQHFDLVVLDLMLPDEDGLSICRRLRVEQPDLPVIMLTARGDEVDRIVGLELGADDYLPKPCSPRELLAHIRAVLRRQVRVHGGAPREPGELLRFGRYTLNLSTRTLLRDGDPLRITTGEFAVLAALVTHPRQPLTRDRLLNLARGRDHEANDRSMDVTVSRLRRLLEADPKSPALIQTVWGLGYVFVPEEPVA